MKRIEEKIGDYFLDISKLIFAGVVLSVILKVEGLPKWMVLISGSSATVTFALIGIYCLLKRR